MSDKLYWFDGVIPCEIIKEVERPGERTSFTVNAGQTAGVDTIEDLTEFDLPEEQLKEIKPWQTPATYG